MGEDRMFRSDQEAGKRFNQKQSGSAEVGAAPQVNRVTQQSTQHNHRTAPQINQQSTSQVVQQPAPQATKNALVSSSSWIPANDVFPEASLAQLGLDVPALGDPLALLPLTPGSTKPNGRCIWGRCPPFSPPSCTVYHGLEPRRR
ncbi:hypothetical protein ACHAPJ_009630 [Fusarium lateritium]